MQSSLEARHANGCARKIKIVGAGPRLAVSATTWAPRLYVEPEEAVGTTESVRVESYLKTFLLFLMVGRL